MNKLNNFKNKFINVPDLIERKIRYNLGYVYLFYIDSICSNNRINDYILKNITNPNKIKCLKNLIAAPNLKKINLSEIDNYIFMGFTIIFYFNKIFALETKADLDRSISTPEIEQDLYGAKDALTENYQKNLGLIKRRIKTSNLKTIEYNLGRITNTKTGILYLDNITKKDIIEKLESIINTIDTDEIIDAGELKQFLTKKYKSIFPLLKLTERPDVIVKALCNGKVVIITDTCPFAIILPAVLADFINPVSDMYLNTLNANTLKVLRFICFLLTIFTPAFYIAVINYNQETIPASLLTSFITQRTGVPFPASIEAFFMLFICEMLRESDIRFPNNFSASISILGALILGEAAVSASVVSPIMIIIIAITFISSMIFSNVELTGSIRFFRYFALFLASIYGLYGVAISGIFLVLNLAKTNSFGLDYTFPAAPFDKSYFKETLFKGKKSNDTKRSAYLTNNIKKG